MIRVLLVDDQALVRGGFHSILDGQDDIEVVGEAADGAEGIDLALATSPDVILMDVRMPRLDGIEATRRLLAGGRVRSRVLVLTTFDQDEYVYAALRELATAVRTVAAGDALLAPEITRRMIEEYVRRPRASGDAAQRWGALTQRELEVLTLVARGHSNAEVAAELFLSELTVKSHVTRVLTKLGLRDRVQAVVFAYESGLIQPGGQ